MNALRIIVLAFACSTAALANTAGLTSAGTAAYPNNGMRRIGSCILSDNSFRSLYNGLYDPTTGYAYFSTAGGTNVNPARIIKVNCNGATPVEVGSCQAGSGEFNLNCGVLDTINGYGYFANLSTSPGHVIKIALGSGNNPPSYVTSIPLNSGEDTVQGAVADLTHGYAYFICTTPSTQQAPTTVGSIIVKVQMTAGTNPPVRVSAGSLNDGERNFRRGVIDTDAGYAYFASNAQAPTLVAKIALGAGASAPSRVAVATIDSAQHNIGSAGIDVVNGYAYFGSYDPGYPATTANVYKVALGSGANPPSLTATTTLASGEGELCSAVLDPVQGIACFATDHRYPGKIYRVRLGAGAAQPAEAGTLSLDPGGGSASPGDGHNVSNVVTVPPSALLPYGEVFLQSAVMDQTRGYAYYGCDSSPGQVVKCAFSQKSVIKGTRVVLADNAAVSDVRFYSHTASGNVRLAIYDNASPRNLVWDSGVVANSTAGAWITVPVSSLTLTAGTYWLAWQVDTSADVPSYTAGASGEGFMLDQTYGAFPASLSGTTSTSEKWSTYFSYTPLPTITTASPLPDGTLGTAYSQTLAASSGTAPYSWSVSAGALPAGMSLGSAGVLSGTPSAAGVFNFTVQVTDAASGTATKAFTLTTSVAALAVTTASPLGGGYVNTGYALPLNANGGAPPYSWSVSAGALPGGLSLSSAGLISGTPTVIGTFNFTAQITDGASGSATKAFALTISAEPVFSTTKIAFHTSRDSNFEIYSMNPDGSSPVRLTNNSGADNNCSFSADGTKIVFVSNRDGNNEIFSMASDGSTQTQLTTTASTVNNTFPAFKPDGSKIVFASTRSSSNLQIFSMDANGANVARLTTNTAADSYPRYSPDGTKIVFQSNRDGNNEIFLMNADGSNQVQLTSTASTVSNISPAFSPDGTKIAFVSNRDGNNEIFTMDTSGNNVTQLTTTASTVNNNFPCYRPDGTKIAYSSIGISATSHVFVINADGSGSADISGASGNGITDQAPSWQSVPAQGFVRFSATGYSVSESAGSATITVKRVSGSSGAIGVSYATSDGTALAGSDYTATSGTLNWADGDTADKTFTVPITSDSSYESHESLTLTLSNATGGASLATPSSATLTILNDDPPLPLITTASPLPGGAAGTAYSQTFAVSGGTPNYSWSVSAGAPPNGLSLSSAGVLSGTPTLAGTFNFTVQVTDSTSTTATKVFAVTITAAPVGTVQFSAASYSVGEGGGTATISVTRTGGSYGAVSASYATVNGTAIAGADYTAVSGTLNWADGDAATKTFTVPILNDTIHENDEMMTLTLSSAVLGSPGAATLTIIDDDPTGGIFPPTQFSSRGIGGGGGMYSPSFSPFDANELYLSCDMSELFHTTTLGTSWETIDFRQVEGFRETEMHFTSDPLIRYVLDFTFDASTQSSTQRPRKSTDGGQHWAPLAAWGGKRAYSVWADPNSTTRLVCATTSDIYVSNDGGASFSGSVFNSSSNRIAGVFFDGQDISVGCNAGLIVSHDGGASFASAGIGGIPAGEAMFSFAGGKQGGVTRFYCVTLGSSVVFPGCILNPFFYRGVYTMDVGQANWTATTNGFTAGTDFPSHVAMARNNISTVYVAAARGNAAPYPDRSTVFKSTSLGGTWQRVFVIVPNNQNIITGWAGTPHSSSLNFSNPTGFCVHPSDVNRVCLADDATIHITTDGGTTWKQTYVNPADQNPANTAITAGKAYRGVGLEPTACFWIHWIDASNLLAGYSDMRLIRSHDGGVSWAYDYSGLSDGECYQIIQHTNGTLYALSSTIISPYGILGSDNASIDGATGSVRLSNNGGANWSTLHNFGAAPMWMALDRANSDTMYVSVAHTSLGGIYVTQNLAAGINSTWTKLSAPARATSGHPYNIRLLNDGSLVCSYSLSYDGDSFTQASGVFITANPTAGAGATWLDRTATGMKYWTQDVVIDPHDASQNTWYACVWNAWGAGNPNPSQQGGLYKTTNRGQSWTRIFSGDSVNSCTISPIRPDEMYVTTRFSGLWYCNNGTSATPVFTQVADYPFRDPTRVFYNPNSLGEIWVTSNGNGLRPGSVPFGGVFKFSASNHSASEAGGNATITVQRSAGKDGVASVSYATGAFAGASAATAGSDYTPASGTLNWADGETADKTFAVPVLNDTLYEPDEYVSLLLSNPSSLSVLGTPGTATLTIVSDDTPMDEWRANHFTAAELGNPLISGDTADPDGDGIDNLLEFAFGLDPKQAAPMELPLPRRVGGNSIISFTQPAGVGGITYRAEWSPDLTPGSWLSVPDTGTGSEHTFSVPFGTNTNIFMRFRITRP